MSRWWKNMRSSVAADRSGSGDTRGSMKTKKVKPTAAVGGGSTFLRFNSAANSQYLGLRSIGGM
jgi:hypothetical protein